MLDTRPSNRRAKPAPAPITTTDMPAQRVESRESLPSAPDQAAGSSVDTPAGTSADQLTTEEIAALAYQLWIERGSPYGSHEEDWHRAEAQLRGRQTLKKTAPSMARKAAQA